MATRFTVEPEQEVSNAEEDIPYEAPSAEATTRSQRIRRSTTKAVATAEPDAEVLQDVDDNNQRQPKPRGRPRKNRSSGGENKVDGTVTEPAADAAEPESTKRTRGRKSTTTVGPEQDVDELATSQIEKTTKIPRGRKPTARGNPRSQPESEPKPSRKGRGKKSLASVEPVLGAVADRDAPGESDHEMTDQKVMTEVERRYADIEKRDRMAQKIMDAMEF